MQHLPIFFQIKNKPCLVVGGGSIAARKVSLLLKAEAEVTVVSPELCDELKLLHGQGRIEHVAREFEDMDLSEQDRMARKRHNSAVDEGQSCIDCHKGVAHEEPDDPTI